MLHKRVFGLALPCKISLNGILKLQARKQVEIILVSPFEAEKGKLCIDLKRGEVLRELRSHNRDFESKLEGM